MHFYTSLDQMLQIIRKLCVYLVPFSSYLRKWPILIHPTCIPFEFRCDLWHQKTSLGYRVICVILRLAILIQYRSVTNTHTHTHTHTHTQDDGIYRASTASRGKFLKSYYFSIASSICPLLSVTL